MRECTRGGSGVAGLVLRCGLVLGWLLTGMGVFGAWVRHETAALSLSGPDLGEFVKFLPAVQGGALQLRHECFYLPGAALAVMVALLAGAPRLRLPAWASWAARALAILVSLQLLPPAWSVAGLSASEFRPQLLALLVCWLLLACSRVLGRLPLWLSGAFSGLLGLLSAALSVWHTKLVLPELAALYGDATVFGGGFWAAHGGLVLAAAASLAVAICSVPRRSRRWRG